MSVSSLETLLLSSHLYVVIVWGDGSVRCSLQMKDTLE